MKINRHLPSQFSLRRIMTVTALIAVYLGLFKPGPNASFESRPDWGMLFLLTQSRSIGDMAFVLAICIPLICCMLAPFIRTTIGTCILGGFALVIWLSIGLLLAIGAAC